ncbi:hypothetical protein ACFRAO_03600 [Streptomyces sp. NPDC056656]|uniref:hypothetical protein n=1 Tax=Streptomyces sp. NPDC056656 TaxID=3345895 RepID=UPI0036A141E0
MAEQNAANARSVQPDTDRTEFLTAVADAWASLDPDEYTFIRSVAGRLRDHDDRAEFLSGIDLILTGITAGQQPTDRRRPWTPLPHVPEIVGVEDGVERDHVIAAHDRAQRRPDLAAAVVPGDDILGRQVGQAREIVAPRDFRRGPK